MLVLWACAILVVIARYPQTPIGKILKRLLVDAPAEWLAKLTPTFLTFAVVLIALSAVLVFYFKAEGAGVVAMSAPEALGWFFAFDIGTYVDIIALAWLAAAAIGVRVVYARARQALSWALRFSGQGARWLAGRIAARNRRTRTRPSGRKPGNADDGWGLGGLAFG